MTLPPLRVAFVAGSLGPGGAEKQLVYMVRALVRAGAAVRVYALTQGEHYEQALRDLNAPPVWIGRHRTPAWRVLALAGELRRFRPHVVQSAHFFTNLHATLASRMAGTLCLGAVRSDGRHDVAANGRWSRWMLRGPDALIANSERAASHLRTLGVPAERVAVLPNVIDLDAFDAAAAPVGSRAAGPVVAIAVARLSPTKRLDRFLAALALARRDVPALRGVVVGDGPERERLRSLAAELGLLPDGVDLLGSRTDVPRLLRGADFLALTSEHEGFPNVLLEAMAAGLPVVTTAAGDAALVVRDGETGYVAAEDPAAIAARMIELARSPDTRQRLGRAGRARVAAEYAAEGLADRLYAIYRQLGGAPRRIHALVSSS